jgi:hypothetical protein
LKLYSTLIFLHTLFTFPFGCRRTGPGSRPHRVRNTGRSRVRESRRMPRIRLGYFQWPASGLLAGAIPSHPRASSRFSNVLTNMPRFTATVSGILMRRLLLGSCSSCHQSLQPTSCMRLALSVVLLAEGLVTQPQCAGWAAHWALSKTLLRQNPHGLVFFFFNR